MRLFQVHIVSTLRFQLQRECPELKGSPIGLPSKSTAVSTAFLCSGEPASLWRTETSLNTRSYYFCISKFNFTGDKYFKNILCLLAVFLFLRRMRFSSCTQRCLASSWSRTHTRSYFRALLYGSVCCVLFSSPHHCISPWLLQICMYFCVY